MEEKIYKCVCGKVFNNPQSFNGHKANCKQHQINKYGNLEKYNDHINKCINARQEKYKEYSNNLKIKNELEKQNYLKNWLLEKHKCEHCGKIMTEFFGSGRFCSRACANSRKYSKESKEKISSSLKNYFKDEEFLKQQQINNIINIINYAINPNICIVCNKPIPYKYRNRKTCSIDCLQKRYRDIGINNASLNIKRSKNEIHFCILCENYFGKDKVFHNIKLFNGWDADIIIPQYNIAILWNGPWHYRKVTKSHNLQQVRNRDAIKIEEIKNCGYVRYIIKDTGKYSENKVKEEFKNLLNFLDSF